MPNENVTPEDLKATAKAKVDDATDAASEKLDDLKDSAQDTFNDVKARLTDLSLNQKLVLTGGLALVSSVVISKIVEKARAVRVDEMNVIVVEGDVLD